MQNGDYGFGPINLSCSTHVNRNFMDVQGESNPPL